MSPDGRRRPTAAELRELTDEELVLRLREAKEELFNLRFQMATGQMDNNRRLRTVRHDIARIYTVMRERELGLSGRPGRERRCRMSEQPERDRPSRSDSAAREARRPQGPRGPGRLGQDGQDDRGRARGPGEAPALLQGHPPHHQGQGARRAGLAGIGDRVLLAETRPLSATKRWRLVEILEKAK